jgi:peptidoglycan hydrolase CwlO-like protein
MKKQYETDSTAAKIIPNKIEAVTKEEKKLEKKVRELEDQVRSQQAVIDRMHRDIVRLRVAINEVSARIK